MSATAPPRPLYVSWSLPAVESRAPQGSNAGRWDLAPMPWPSLTIHPPGSDAQRRPPQIRHPGQRPAPHPSISSPRLSSGDPRADPAAAARPVPGRLPARLTAFVGPGRRPQGRPRSWRDRASGGRGGDACAVAPVPWLSPLAGSLRHGAAFKLKNRTTSPPDRQTLRKSWPCAEEEAGRLLSPGAAASTWAGSAPRASSTCPCRTAGSFTRPWNLLSGRASTLGTGRSRSSSGKRLVSSASGSSSGDFAGERDSSAFSFCLTSHVCLHELDEIAVPSGLGARPGARPGACPQAQAPPTPSDPAEMGGIRQVGAQQGMDGGPGWRPRMEAPGGGRRRERGGGETRRLLTDPEHAAPGKSPRLASLRRVVGPAGAGSPRRGRGVGGRAGWGL